MTTSTSNIGQIFSTLADAIREKCDSERRMTPFEMAAEVRNIQTSDPAIDSFNLRTLTQLDCSAKSIKPEAFASYTSAGCKFYSNSIAIANFSQCSEIGDAAFSNCSKLRSVSFPVCQSIGSSAFNCCYSLNSASFPQCRTIGFRAFYSCSQISYAYFPMCEELLLLGGTTTSRSFGQQFYSCSKLMSAYFPNARTIASQAFVGCSQLSDVNIRNVVTVGSSAFTGCKIKSLDLEYCTTIGDRAFGSNSTLTFVNIPLCSVIGTGAFQFCPLMSTCIAPNLQYAGTNAFNGCSALTSIDLPRFLHVGSPTTAPATATLFNNCINLSYVRFVDVENIKHGFFTGCTKLMEIRLEGSHFVGLSASTAFNSTPIVSSALTGSFGSIYVPASLLTTYKTAANWSLISDRIVGI